MEGLIGNCQLDSNHAVPEINCIRLDVEVLHPLPDNDGVNRLIEICVMECLVALPYGSLSD